MRAVSFSQTWISLCAYFPSERVILKLCCLQPDDRVIITVTWTPAEEGGVRELLSFIANGIVKHQAILLGKADSAKPKKVNNFFIGNCSRIQHCSTLLYLFYIYSVNSAPLPVSNECNLFISSQLSTFCVLGKHLLVFTSLKVCLYLKNKFD